MKFLKSFEYNRMLLMVLLVCYVDKVSARKCKYALRRATEPLTSKYDITKKVILSSNPQVQIHAVDLTPKHRGEDQEDQNEKKFYILKNEPKFKDVNDSQIKENVWKTIIKALDRKPPATSKTSIPSSTPSPPIVHNMPTYTESPYNPTIYSALNCQSILKHYVYNIQNHGTHHHYYGSPATDYTQNNAFEFKPLQEANNTTQFTNKVPLNK